MKILGHLWVQDEKKRRFEKKRQELDNRGPDKEHLTIQLCGQICIKSRLQILLRCFLFCVIIVLYKSPHLTAFVAVVENKKFFQQI